MRLDDFLELLEGRIRSTPKDRLASAILAAINDTRKKAELDQEEDDALWLEVRSANLGQD